MGNEPVESAVLGGNGEGAVTTLFAILSLPSSFADDGADIDGAGGKLFESKGANCGPAPLVLCITRGDVEADAEVPDDAAPEVFGIQDDRGARGGVVCCFPLSEQKVVTDPLVLPPKDVVEE